MLAGPFRPTGVGVWGWGQLGAVSHYKLKEWKLDKSMKIKRLKLSQKVLD